MIGMGAKEARIEVLLWEKNVPRSIHMRIWNIEPKKGIMNTRLFLSKNPLKIFIGQKFSIKVNFDKTISCMHLNVQSSSNSEFFEIRKDIDKNYFNCVSYLVAQPMTN